MTPDGRIGDRTMGSGVSQLRGPELTLYQLPITFYQLPSFPISFLLSGKELLAFREVEVGVVKSRGSGDLPFLIDSVYLQSRSGPERMFGPAPPNSRAPRESQKRLDTPVGCGYICDMTDRSREKDSMVHVRFTEEERRELKAKCAIRGLSMQEYIRELVLKGLSRLDKRGKK